MGLMHLKVLRMLADVITRYLLSSKGHGEHSLTKRNVMLIFKNGRRGPETEGW